MKLRKIPNLLLVLGLAAIAVASQAPGRGSRTERLVLVPSDQMPANVRTITGNVIYVYDGDTFSVAVGDDRVYTIRLEGVDAPEIGQEFGLKSKQALSALVGGMNVTVLVEPRTVGRAYLGRAYVDRQDVNEMILESGAAWFDKDTFEKQPEYDLHAFKNAEQRARTAKKGLWESGSPVAPWDYRAKWKAIDESNGTTSPDVSVAGRTDRFAGTVGGTTVSRPEPKVETAEGKPAEKDKTEAVVQPTTAKKYILGPRGGCYYLSDSGKKMYVSHNRCVGN